MNRHFSTKISGPLQIISSEDSQTERDRFEAHLIQIFTSKILRIEKASKEIGQFKDGSYAMSQMGMMLYTNGYNLRGISHNYPNGILYYDGENLFGIGYFAKEGEHIGHLMIVSPKGPRRIQAVNQFIDQIRSTGLSKSSIYVRYLASEDRDEFVNNGFVAIETDPWHPEAIEEDESHPNRLFHLEELIEVGEKGKVMAKILASPEDQGHKKKSYLAINRFENFLERNDFHFQIEPYTYSESEQRDAQKIVEEYFTARRNREGVVGSTPEDYFALVRQIPDGENEKDYFAYQAKLTTPNGNVIPFSFFAGEKISARKVGLYATITQRFPEYLSNQLQITGDTPVDMQGFTAIPQYAWLQIFGKLRAQGIEIVDAGGSETKGLDIQKRQLGGKPNKTHWVVKT